MSISDYKIKPNLIIGGVFKGGTTSLFSYLSEHNDISTSSKKEIGYFVPIQFNQPLSPINEYLQYFKHIKESPYVLEASPGYLYGGYKIANSMKDVLDDFKIIFVLREPKDRLISFYKYLKTSYVFAYGDTLSISQKKFIQEMTFDKYVNEAVNYFEKNSTKDPSEAYCLSGVSYSLYSSHLKEWYDIIGGENIKIVFFDSLKNSPFSLMCEICDWLGISSSVYENYSFIVQNKTRDVHNKSIHKFASKLNRKFEPILRLNPFIKNNLRDIYYYFNQKNNHHKDVDISVDVQNIFNSEIHDLKLLLTKHGYNILPLWIT